jgi:pre-mRNA-splicing factor ATP-dependent RNA helicase DHX38/PRP16
MDESKMSRVDLSSAKDREDFAFMKDQDEYTAIEWEQREQALDRAWYDADEDGNVRYGNDDLDDFMAGPTEEERALQEELLRKKKQESQPISRRTLNSADHDKWELNRMLQSGAVKNTSSTADSSMLLETDEERVILMVHDIKPPFLDGRIVFTKQTEAVQVVKDANGDFYQASKKGSQVLRVIRESQNRAAMREKFWELAGTKMGNLLKINKEAEKIENSITQPAIGSIEKLN